MPLFQKQGQITDVEDFVAYSLQRAPWVLLRPPTGKTNQTQGDKANGSTSQPNDAIFYAELARFLMHSQHDLTSYFLRPWRAVRPGFEPETSLSAFQCSTNWAALSRNVKVSSIKLTLFRKGNYLSILATKTQTN